MGVVVAGMVVTVMVMTMQLGRRSTAVGDFTLDALELNRGVVNPELLP
jgi:hypothetical protein